jgi:hypothetical protein
MNCPEEPEDKRTLQDLAKEALQVQDAVNLTGVAQSFARAMKRLMRLEPSMGTLSLNTHPIAVLWADKIRSLTGNQSASVFSKAYAWCAEKAETKS